MSGSHKSCLIDALYNKMNMELDKVILFGIDLDGWDEFWERNKKLCQMLGAVLRHVYDWEMDRTSSRNKKMIQESEEWSSLLTACVWITTRTRDDTCRSLYAECVSAEKTQEQKLQDGALLYILDNKEKYEPKLPRPSDDMDVADNGVKTSLAQLKLLAQEL
jgi:hypothetical protein